MLYTLPEESFLRSNYVENQSALQEWESILSKHLSKKRSSSSKSLRQTELPLKATSAVSSFSVNLTPFQANRALHELKLSGSSLKSESSLSVRPSVSVYNEPLQRKWGRLVNTSGSVPPNGYSLYQLGLILGKGYDVEDLTAIQRSLNSPDEACVNFTTRECAVVGKRLSPSANPKHTTHTFGSSQSSLTTKPRRRYRKIRYGKASSDNSDLKSDSSTGILKDKKIEFCCPTEALLKALPDNVNCFIGMPEMADKCHTADTPSSSRETPCDLGSPKTDSSHSRRIVHFSEDECEDDFNVSSEVLEFDESIFNDTDFDNPSPVDRHTSTPDYVREYIQRTMRENTPSLVASTDTESCTSSQDSLRVFCDEESNLDLQWNASGAAVGVSQQPFFQLPNEEAHPRNQRSPLVPFPRKLRKSSVQRSRTSSNIHASVTDKCDKSGSMPSVSFNSPRSPPK